MANAYADTTAVQALINALSGTGITLGTTSTPTLAQAQTICDQVAAEVNGVLQGAGYGTVPATGTNDILMIARHVTQKTAALVYHAGYGGFGETPARVKEWESEYKEFLARLESKALRLVDQAPTARIGVVHVGRYIEG